MNGNAKKKKKSLDENTTNFAKKERRVKNKSER